MSRPIQPLPRLLACPQGARSEIFRGTLWVPSSSLLLLLPCFNSELRSLDILLRKEVPRSSHGTRGYHCAFNPFGRLRQPRRGVPKDDCSRRRLAPCRHHVRSRRSSLSARTTQGPGAHCVRQGWALCAQHHVRTSCGGQDPVPCRQAHPAPREGDV